MTGNINEKESGKIWVPVLLNSFLWRDAELFEVFIGKDERVAINTFLNELIPGYYEQYKQELARQKEGIRDLLSSYISSASKLDRIIDRLVWEEHMGEYEEHKSKKVAISFSPRKDETVAINAEIERAAGKINQSRSEYYKNMLLSYSHKPMYERERLVYHENTERIVKVLKSRKKQELIFISRDNPRAVHVVLPYKLVHGADEQFNYLIGQEKIGKRYMACTYRLRRIIISGTQPAESTLDSKVNEHLDLMEYYDPLYPINEHTETCVEFTEEGLKHFRRIYMGRPKMELIKGSKTKFTTFCSQEQLFNYFKRFNPGEANVLYPDKLRRTLSGFHEKHLEALKDGISDKK